MKEPSVKQLITSKKSSSFVENQVIVKKVKNNDFATQKCRISRLGRMA